MGLRDRIPHSLNLSHPAGMSRLHLIAALAETKVITAFHSLDALAPSDQLFHDRLASAIQGGYRATAMRKTVILLDSHFEAQAQARQAQAAARAASEAEQARLAARREAEAQAAVELHRQAIDRAEELVTRLAAQDPYLRQALEETNTDLAALFNRLRTPESEPEPAPAGPDQKEIDTVAEEILDDLFNKLRRAHPESHLGFANAAWHAAELARVDRGEPDPHGYDDDFDDLADEDDDFEGDDDFTGSADAHVRPSAPDPQSDPSSPYSAAGSLGPRTASSAHAPARSLAPLSPITSFVVPPSGGSSLPVPHDAPQTSTNEHPSIPQAFNMNSAFQGRRPSGSSGPHSSISSVPSCPTLSARRLANLLSESEADNHFPQTQTVHPTQSIEPSPESESPITPAKPAPAHVISLIEPPTSPDLTPPPSHFTAHFTARGRSPTSF